MNLVRELCAANSHVTVMDDFSAAPRTNLSGLPVDIVERSVMEESSFAKLPDIDHVFHLASPSSVILYGKEPQKCFSTTTISMINVLRYAKTNGVKKVVYPSSGSVYGRASPPQKETTIPRPTKDRKSTRLNSSHRTISYAVFCLKKKKIKKQTK